MRRDVTMSDAQLVSPEELDKLLQSEECRAVDCRFNLLAPEAGRDSWRSAHVPGAVYADLDRDLAAPVTDSTGRHPLPDAARFAAFLGRIGWQPGLRLVAYDDAGGALAVRFWWLMRFFGHDVVSLLDGGLPAWIRAGHAMESGDHMVSTAPAPPLNPDREQALGVSAVAAQLDAGRILLLDARDAARFDGASEPIDPVAGHVPGAVNRPFQQNLDDHGRFLPAAALRSEFEALLAGRDPAEVVHMCGSGVTACHNLFAMERAGLAGSRLYVGSWSEWIRDPVRPVATA